MIRDLQMPHKSNHNENCHSLENNFEVLELQLFTVKNGLSTVRISKAIKTVNGKSC